MKRNMKALYEQRTSKLNRMNELLGLAEKETRAFTAEEQTEYDTLAGEVRGLNATIKAAGDADDLEGGAAGGDGHDEDEVRSFMNYLRTGRDAELRANKNLTFGANGALVPATIANKIIDKVHELSPIYGMATHYNVPGTLTIPYVDASEDDVTVAWADEFSTLTAHANSYKSITLTGYLDSCLTLISRQLMNNSNFDVLGLTVSRMAVAYASFFEKQCLKGTSGKATGILSGVAAEHTVTAAAANKLTLDELIDVQEAIPDVYQQGAIWVMSRKTRAFIRKLKDNDGKYLLNPDATAPWGYVLLGKPVFVSENMDEMEAGKDAILYGDPSGLAVKESEALEIQVLYDQYATQHAVGVLGWNELDTKVENAQKFAKLTMKAGA